MGGLLSHNSQESSPKTLLLFPSPNLSYLKMMHQRWKQIQQEDHIGLRSCHWRRTSIFTWKHCTEVLGRREGWLTHVKKSFLKNASNCFASWSPVSSSPPIKVSRWSGSRLTAWVWSTSSSYCRERVLSSELGEYPLRLLSYCTVNVGLISYMAVSTERRQSSSMVTLVCWARISSRFHAVCHIWIKKVCQCRLAWQHMTELVWEVRSCHSTIFRTIFRIEDRDLYLLNLMQMPFKNPLEALLGVYRLLLSLLLPGKMLLFQLKNS